MCDVTDTVAYQSHLRDVEAELRAIRVLVNNAGNDQRHTLAELTPEYWDHCQALNLKHQVFAIQQVAPGMATAGGGSIINLGSVSWMRGRANQVGYPTAKAAISGLSRTLARELGEKNIRVNTLAPGAIVTDWTQRTLRAPHYFSHPTIRTASPARTSLSMPVSAGVCCGLDKSARQTAGEIQDNSYPIFEIRLQIGDDRQN